MIENLNTFCVGKNDRVTYYSKKHNQILNLVDKKSDDFQMFSSLKDTEAKDVSELDP
jgi:hypothetical protein